tara:strand:+ start:2424 stop:2738 length:315 start_codon:yes stop_codon:yes gene_type:complete
MDLIIHGSLTIPPSQVYCFRDISLYAKCFLNSQVFVECNKNEIDEYWYWLKDNNSYDFVDGMLRTNEIHGFKVGPKERSNLKIQSIDHFNQQFILKILSKTFRI